MDAENFEEIPRFLTQRPGTAVELFETLANNIAATESGAISVGPTPEQIEQAESVERPSAQPLVGTDIDVFRSEIESRRERAEMTLRTLDAERVEVEGNRDTEVAAIQERAVAEEAAVLKRANDRLADISSRIAQHEAILAGCEAATKASEA